MAHTIEFTDDELQILRTALQTFFDDYGHKEQDELDRIKTLIAKLPPADA